MPQRIQVLLDYPFTSTYGEGWGMAKMAGALQFAKRATISAGVITPMSETKVEPCGTPKGLWKVPGLGVITLAPSFIEQGVVEYDSPLSRAYTPAEVDVSNDTDGFAALRHLTKVGTFARTRQSATSTLVGLLATTAEQAILDAAAQTQKIIWRTKASLAANEGWRFWIQPVRTFDDPNQRDYLTLFFGGRFSLNINLQGTAFLNENVGTSSAPVWLQRKSMNPGDAGVDLTKQFTVSLVTVAGRYLVLLFGNVRFKGNGLRLSSYVEEKDYVFDTHLDGIGNYYDAGLDQYVATQPGKLALAVNATKTDYRFTPYKLRYDTSPVTTLFTGEPLPNLLPDQTPVVEGYGYFTNSDDEATGSGNFTVSYENELGGPWTPASDTLIIPKLTLQATNPLYSPELWYIEGRAYPKTVTPPYEEDDASDEWTHIRFSRTARMEASTGTIKLNDEARFDRIFRRGGPIRITVDGAPIYDGYVESRKPTSDHKFNQTELSLRDMWDRLETRVGNFESLDGKDLGDVIFRLLRRAGFDDDQIEVDDLSGLKIEGFEEPQSLKIYNPNTKVSEALRDLAEKYSIQGIEGVRVRWDGAKWRVYLAPAQRGYGATGDDPALILYAGDVAPTGPDSSRWNPVDDDGDPDPNGYRWLKITSAMEWDVQRPPFNALMATVATAGGDGASALKGFILPRDEVLNDPTSQLFEGHLRFEEMSAPENTATSKEGLTRQMRIKYDAAQRNVVGLGVQAEWQPFADADLECAVLGVDPTTGDPVSFGVYRIESIDVEISRDGTNVDWEWSGSYRLRWIRETSDGFAPNGDPIAKYGGLVPPPNYLTGTSEGSK